MKHCPECGGKVRLVDTFAEEAFQHIRYRCIECAKMWDATISNGVMHELLHISPVEEEGGE